jgi:hypothetical protein
MLLIGILITAVIGMFIMLSDDNSQKVYDDFCKNECKRDIRRKYKYCC